MVGIFGIAVGQEFQRTLHVRKEHSQMLALALESGDCAGCDARALGLMGYTCGGRSRAEKSERSTTSPAKRLGDLVEEATKGTSDRQRPAAHAAEASASAIVRVAPQAPHGRIARVDWRLGSIDGVELEYAEHRQPKIAGR